MTALRTEMKADGHGQPYDARTVRAIVAFLEGSKHCVHRGAARKVAEHFLPDGRIDRARAVASEKGWPIEAVLAGIELSVAGARTP